MAFLCASLLHPPALRRLDSSLKQSGHISVLNSLRLGCFRGSTNTRDPCGRTLRKGVMMVRARKNDDEGAFSLGRVAGSVLGGVDLITDAVAKVAPDTVSRSVVDIGVKGGLVLVVLTVARSLLSVALTCGVIVLGLWIASQFLGADDSKRSDGGSSTDATRRSRMRSVGRSTPVSRQPSVNLGDDLSEVWFDDASRSNWPRQSPSRKPQSWQQYQQPLLVAAEWEERQQNSRSARWPNSPSQRHQSQPNSNGLDSNISDYRDRFS